MRTFDEEKKLAEKITQSIIEYFSHETNEEKRSFAKLISECVAFEALVNGPRFLEEIRSQRKSA